MEELSRRDHVLRIDLENLPRDDIDTLLHLALGGPVKAAAGEALWTRSHGNLLFLRTSCSGRTRRGGWSRNRGSGGYAAHCPTPRASPSWSTSVSPRCPPDTSDLLGLLALREPLGVSALTDLVGQQPLDELDRAALLRVVSGGRRQHVSLAHPLYSEVVRERLAPLTRRRLLLVYADRIEGFGARRREDTLRVANARLDAEGVADHALVLAAARLARYGHDYPQVERLARAALVEQVSPEALLLLAEALHELGAYADAEAVLVRHEAVIAGADETDRVRLVAIRVRNLMWGLDRADEALAVNRATCAEISDDEGRAELVADEAMVLAFGGHPADALAVLDAHEPGGPRGQVLRSIAEVPALILTGRCETARDSRVARSAEHEALGDQLAIAHPGIHVIQEVYALMDSGRIEDAWQLASAAFPIATRVRRAVGSIWFAFGLGRSAWLAGRLETARRWLAESAGLCSDYGFDGPRRIALVAARDECRPARRRRGLRCGGRRARPPPVVRVTARPSRSSVTPGRRLPTVSSSTVATSCSRPPTSGRGPGEHAIEVVLLHDAARLGEPAAVRERIEAVAAECEGDLARVCAEHVHALAGRSPSGLAAVADGFDAIGARLFAAEAATAAARAYRQRGDGRTATAMAAKATALAQHCEGARTPGLLDVATPEPLTAREQEIAILAAERLQSKEIADRLSLSVRTVNNHLQRIYVKLGVTSRTELAAALAAV